MSERDRYGRGEPASGTDALPTVLGRPAPSAGTDALPTVLVGPESGATTEDPILGEAARIGRFTVLSKLGEGAMGVVYSAYDEELDRRIAIKLVAGDSVEQYERSGRLLREAQAMAKLSHPNVAQVYEFGDYMGQIFIAMEYVDGLPLDEWAHAEPSQADEPVTGEPPRPRRRDWREVLAMHLQAGEGLRAAHRANLIHRDYKPANVLVGHDGRARVLDFGLVRAHRTEGATGRSALDRSITKSGSVLGTPAYMSLEQLLGDPADARSDQFGFCVALYEALYRRHPFTDDGVGRVAHIMRGNIRPPQSSRVPGRVFAAISRGLSADRKDRWPSMDELLAELRAVLAHHGAGDLDLAVGFRQRQIVFIGLALLMLTVFLPASVPGVGPPWLYSPIGAVAVSGVLAAVLLLMFTLARRALLRNQINRWISYWLLLLAAGVLLGRAVGYALDEPYEHVYVQEAIGLAIGLSIGGAMIVRWMLVLGALWIGVAVASAFAVERAPMINASALFVTCVLATFLSRRTQALRIDSRAL